jgi:hypothetical protein
MPTFEIPDGPIMIELKRSGDSRNSGPAQGSAVFTVINTSTENCEGRLSVQAAGAAKMEWFTIDGDRERCLPPRAAETVHVRLSIPPDVAPGDYPFRLRIVNINDPDDDYALGPVATAAILGADLVSPAHSLWLLAPLLVPFAL